MAKDRHFRCPTKGDVALAIVSYLAFIAVLCLFRLKG
jgi:hypothetical protein